MKGEDLDSDIASNIPAAAESESYEKNLEILQENRIIFLINCSAAWRSDQNPRIAIRVPRV